MITWSINTWKHISVVFKVNSRAFLTWSWCWPAVCLRDRGTVVSCCSLLRAILCDLPTSGEHPTASKACSHWSAVCVDLLLHLDLPSSAGLEQIHYKQDRNYLWARLVSSEQFYLPSNSCRDKVVWLKQRYRIGLVFISSPKAVKVGFWVFFWLHFLVP